MPRNGERFVRALLVLVCAAAGLYAIHPVANPDFGWHVALGRWMLAHGGVPSTEPFTHTAAGVPMVAHQWLSQLLYALAIEGAGVRGLRFANGVLVSFVVALLYHGLRRSGARPSLALLLAVVWAAIAASRFQLRPHMFNLLFFVGAYCALFVARARLTHAQLAAFFAATVLWINLHSGAVVFATLIALHAAAATFEQRILHRPPVASEPGEGKLARLWALAALTGAAILCSPNHVRIVDYVLASRRINAGLSLEWFSIASSQSFAAHGTLVLLGIAGLGAATLVLAWQRRREVSLARLIVVGFVAMLPFLGQRFTWTSFVPALFVAEGLSQHWPRELESRKARVTNAACIALALLIAATTFGESTAPDRLRRRLENVANFATGMFPTSAVTFLEETSLSGRLFNGNKWGGYILLRTQERIPTFVDGRWVTLGEKIVRDARTISLRRPGFLKKLADYDVEIVLVERGWMTDALRESANWRTAFENFNSGIYLRAGPALEANLARCANYYQARGIPFEPEYGFREQAAFETNRVWARQMHVRRFHLEQFGHYGVRALEDEARWVPGWPE